LALSSQTLHAGGRVAGGLLQTEAEYDDALAEEGWAAIQRMLDEDHEPSAAVVARLKRKQ